MTDLVDRLEAEIDKCGIRAVLEAISIICDLKAEHLASNWQDVTSAKAWVLWQLQIDRMLSKIKEVG